MAKLSQSGFSKVVPTLKASDLKGADSTVITIKAADVVPNPNPGRGNARKQLLRLRMNEWPEKVYYPNPTGVSVLMDKFGDDTADMLGKKVPLHVVATTNPQSGQDVEALQVVPGSQWDAFLEEAEETSRSGRGKK